MDVLFLLLRLRELEVFFNLGCPFSLPNTPVNKGRGITVKGSLVTVDNHHHLHWTKPGPGIEILVVILIYITYKYSSPRRQDVNYK